MSSLFLSVSVPDPASEFHKTCDPMLIQAALRSFLFTVLGHKHVVFGGHPSISGLILAVCEDIGIANKSAVTIYQSAFFEGSFPEEYLKFANFIVTPAGGDLQASLSIMRQQMIQAHPHDAAVFIGGKEGILDEYRQFKQAHPNAKVLALKSPGGAAALIKEPEVEDYDELLDYVGLFATGLSIKVGKKRPLELPESEQN